MAVRDSAAITFLLIVLLAGCTVGEDDPSHRSDDEATHSAAPSRGAAPGGLANASVQGPWSMAMLSDHHVRRSPLPARLNIRAAARAPSLIDSPIKRAAMIARNEIFTGNEDRLLNGHFIIRSAAGVWRTLTPSELGAVETDEERAFSVSADGTWLAFGDRKAVIVVEVSTGKIRRFDVPFAMPMGLNWVPGGNLIHASDRDAREERPILLNTRNGRWRHVPYSIFTTDFTTSGTPVELNIPRRGSRSSTTTGAELRTYAATGSTATPLHLKGITGKHRAVGKFTALVRSGSLPRAGFTVVNRQSGEPVAHLKMDHPTSLARSWLTLHGWLNPHILLFGDGWGKGDGGFLLAWDWKTHEVQTVTRLPGGGGIDFDVATDVL